MMSFKLFDVNINTTLNELRNEGDNRRGFSHVILFRLQTIIKFNIACNFIHAFNVPITLMYKILWVTNLPFQGTLKGRDVK